ncbi:MAG: hypothetical protein K2K80_01465 [Clostridia bacterium]|nr:hypothetical protein [Clostridia bacterium]
MLFGKKKKDSADEWKRTAEKLHDKGELPSPYESLFLYCVYMMSFIPKRKYRGVGHHSYFEDAEMKGNLDAVVRDMQSILPPHLADNFNSALELYKSFTEDTDFDTFLDEFDKYDSYTYDYDDEMNDILRHYIELSNL